MLQDRPILFPDVHEQPVFASNWKETFQQFLNFWPFTFGFDHERRQFRKVLQKSRGFRLQFQILSPYQTHIKQGLKKPIKFITFD